MCKNIEDNIVKKLSICIKKTILCDNILFLVTIFNNCVYKPKKKWYYSKRMRMSEEIIDFYNLNSSHKLYLGGIFNGQKVQNDGR